MFDCQSLFIIVVSICISTVILDSTGNGKGCYYKGSYHNGNWTDGCDFNCTCLDSEKGHYKCHTRCPVYPQLPAGCVLKLPFGEKCCKQPDCSAITSYYNNNNHSSNNTRTGNGDSDEISENTKFQHKSSNGNATDTEEEKGCLYGGKYYHGNWTDGCEFNCTCEEPVLGIYRCKKRCREYTELDPGCILKVSHTDSCCKVPVCDTTESIQSIETKSSQIKTTTESVMFTTLPPILVDYMTVTTMQPNNLDNPESVAYKTVSVSDQSQNNNQDLSNAKKTEELAIIFSRFGPIRLFTVRKNINTNSGTQNEENGIGETTTSSGVEKERHSLIEKNKREFNNRNNGQMHDISGSEALTTETHLETIGGVCPYKGMNFTQGEQWYDGCDYICMCENATRGFYKCRSRCQKYNALPVGCVMERSKVDDCCLVPNCHTATVTNDNQPIESSRILPKIEELEKTQKSMLKRLFNQRIQMRNKMPQTDKEKAVIIEGRHEVSIDTPNTLDTIHERHHNIDKSHVHPDVTITNSSKQIYIRDLERNLELLERTYLRITNRSSQRQQIVKPFNLNISDLDSEGKTSSVYAEGKEEIKGNINEPYRTIATETGLYKVRKRDGVISPYSQSIASVLKRKVDLTVSEKSMTEFCEYNTKFYQEGETWFDGCELSCICQRNGQYTCYNRCPEYSHIPSGCSLITPRIGQCCPLLVCRRLPSRNHPLASYLNF